MTKSRPQPIVSLIHYSDFLDSTEYSREDRLLATFLYHLTSENSKYSAEIIGNFLTKNIIFALLKTFLNDENLSNRHLFVRAENRHGTVKAFLEEHGACDRVTPLLENYPIGDFPAPDRKILDFELWTDDGPYFYLESELGSLTRQKEDLRHLKEASPRPEYRWFFGHANTLPTSISRFDELATIRGSHFDIRILVFRAQVKSTPQDTGNNFDAIISNPPYKMRLPRKRPIQSVTDFPLFIIKANDIQTVALADIANTPHFYPLIWQSARYLEDRRRRRGIPKGHARERLKAPSIYNFEHIAELVNTDPVLKQKKT